MSSEPAKEDGLCALQPRAQLAKQVIGEPPAWNRQRRRFDADFALVYPRDHVRWVRTLAHEAVPVHPEPEEMVGAEPVKMHPLKIELGRLLHLPQPDEGPLQGHQRDGLGLGAL